MTDLLSLLDLDLNSKVCTASDDVIVNLPVLIEKRMREIIEEELGRLPSAPLGEPSKLFSSYPSFKNPWKYFFVHPFGFKNGVMPTWQVDLPPGALGQVKASVSDIKACH